MRRLRAVTVCLLAMCFPTLSVGQDVIGQPVVGQTIPHQQFQPAQIAPAAKKTADEYQVKSVFLYSFHRFVTWPKDMPRLSHFHIGVIGSSPIQTPLDKVAKKMKLVTDRRNKAKLPLKVSYFETLDDYESCQILFVSRSVTQEQQREIMKRLKTKPVLLVGESSQFAQDGGTAEFIIVNGRVKFNLNLADAKRKRMKCDAKLLKMAYTILKPTETKTTKINSVGDSR